MTTHPFAFEWTETNREWFIENPIRIAAYVLVALIVRYVLHRMIDRATRRPRPAGVGASTSKPALIRHLRERSPSSRNPDVAERRAQRARTIGSVLKSTVSIILLVWVVLSVLSVLGVNIAPFIASAGIVGLAVGFGAQNLVRDFVTGVFMLLEDQYGVGDIVDLGEAIGEVESVGLRVTTLRDVDGTLWYVRNGEIARVGNMSQEFAVARVDVPVSPAADVDKAQHVAERAAIESAERDSSDMLGSVDMLGVQAVAADQVVLRLTVKTRANAQWAVARRLRSDILRAFVENDVALPYQPWAQAATSG
ncbi:MscS Mechanosensitive ion channel [Gordonia bronchialis DSM 43247]|uniref:MscS Mechanosensitive ion channel n=1 Tax=Gordonia bronchialis (strain ATCC 25592 / DSM 43247 / BCRC 13721 / JCM 3198 / KCTC 3076 / NBRC 16047 / NCTC 10667) TaxID=526226 RepID=D0LDQ0_GORB4|nr:mechanosensitive ion channel domain-containing protein [Gordonia bronchialis]ACY21673.1 MscS Mechanosensitive ion channel [Gordonia bronchialis DSM 43247]MCC3324460.1 mechanosensitive ion channel family protein [Gordonia bronchialis]QGS24701.1 mechanosensitive ion channel [Gordonia bronchialis]UAK39048.1 mechanosensitive ion channel family protein [Gordonia bronchialis]STQ64561.1 Small-conductance mechanosensitive channel [Gordonia bronchialis]